MQNKNKDNYVADVLDCEGNVLMTTQEEASDASKSALYNELKEVIRNSVNKTEELNMVIGYNLKKIKENKLYLEGGYKNVYEFAEAEFDMSKAKVVRLIKICTYFSKGNNSPILDKKYEGFSGAQLYELTLMSPEERELVTPDISSRQINRLRKDSKKKKEALAEKVGRIQEAGTVLHQTETEIVDISPAKEGTQPELPYFNAKKECIAWLQNIEAWGVWYEDRNIQARYFKYDFADGSRLIAVKYRYTCPPYMRDEPKRYKEQVAADGEYYGPTYYHMICSDKYLENHQEEYRRGFRKYFTADTISMDSLADFLMEFQSKKDEKDAYTYCEIEFDADHLEEEEIKRLPSKARQYARFYKEHKYIPHFFNIKNKKEIIDVVPTLTTSSGSFGGIGAVSVFDLSKNIMSIVDDEKLSYAEKGRQIKMLMSIACPEERQKMEKFYGTKSGWTERLSGFDVGKIRFFIRKYTPEQAFELMGMTKEDVRRCRAVGVSDTQLFKQAGNGIVTNVVRELAKSLYKAQYSHK